MPVRSVFAIAWLLFLAYRWISAMGVKKNVRRRSLRWEDGVRLLAIAVIVSLARIPGSRVFFQAPASAAVNSTETAAGLILWQGFFSVTAGGFDFSDTGGVFAGTAGCWSSLR